MIDEVDWSSTKKFDKIFQYFKLRRIQSWNVEIIFDYLSLANIYWNWKSPAKLIHLEKLFYRCLKMSSPAFNLFPLSSLMCVWHHPFSSPSIFFMNNFEAFKLLRFLSDLGVGRFPKYSFSFLLSFLLHIIVFFCRKFSGNVLSKEFLKR